MDYNKVYQGNNIDVLRTFPDNSIDSVVTDPPYGLGKEPNIVEVVTSWIEKGHHEISGKGFMGKEWDAFVPQPIFWKEVYRVLKPGGHVLSFAGTRTYDWTVMAIRFAGFEIRDMLGWLYGSGFPKSHDMSKAIDKANGAEREVVGSKNVKDFSNHKGSMMSKITTDNFETHATDIDITAPSTDQAKQYEGWGTALKPAIEPIVLARKPFNTSVAENVLKYGTGGINIDGCRIGTEESVLEPATPKKGTFNCGFDSDYQGNTVIGRWPANILLDGSEEVLAVFPNSEGGGYPKDNTQGSLMFGTANLVRKERINIPDSGSAARFFYTAKTSQSERNMGLYGFEEKTVDDGRKKSIDNAFQRGETKRRNIHPTVKPLDLMRYLVRLVTPPNGLCLDPFLGSGTTAIACKLEGFRYIGIELDEEYCKIANARIDNCDKDYEQIDKLLAQDGVIEAPTIFDFMEEGAK